MSKSFGDYEVGYGKPPKQHQFRKGQSGNPNGRPRKNETLADLVVKLLDEPIQVRTKDGTFTMTSREAIVRTLIQRAATGDVRQTKMLMELIETNERETRADQPQTGVVVVPVSFDIDKGPLLVEDVEDDEFR